MKCIHITCPNCNKIFEVESNLIPQEGRDVKCSACYHTWFYENDKIRNEFSEILKKYPSELPKDLEDLILDAETTK
tara:strand:+ start:1381 stop:1608 length:228 start_codon:yes stop_codon:yes gene_type:complete